MVTLRLNQPIHRKIADGNPWVFADAIDPPDDLETGTSVEILESRGDFLGRGIYERDSPIAVRMWTLKDEQVDDNLLAARITEADNRRRRWLTDQTTGFRLLNGEGDRTPGVVCDIYGDCAVIRIDGRAAERWLEATIDSLRELRDIVSIVVRRSEKYRGDYPRAVWTSARGIAVDPKIENEVEFLEHGIKFVCDPIEGQKTGFFLDQRANRQLVGRWAKDRYVLNLFGYTGGFSVVAAAMGANQTTTVDLAKPALEMARKNFDLNGLSAESNLCVASDVEQYLAQFHKNTAPFDLVICDPPSFAHRRKDKPKAIKTYTRLFTKTLNVMPHGSTVALASCSSHIGRGDFLSIVRAAAKASGKTLTVHAVSGADVDHPHPIGFPEHDYLQFLLGTI